MAETSNPDPPSRRALLTGSAGGAAALAFGRAHGMAAPAASGGARVEKDTEGLVETAVHGGAGLIRVKWFDFQKAAQPALMLTYLIPPGASEGVHVHRLGDARLGSYDEFYYVLEGEGVMEIDGRPLPVSAGDHVFTPLGAPHGVRNTGKAPLKIFLTAMMR